MGGKIYKTLQPNDKVTKKDLLHEAIPITGSLVSGTYLVSNADENVKNYSHGMFQSVYDYPYLSSSANHIFDITCGFSSNSALSASTPGTQQAKKINIYNQMAQVLAGHNADGTIREFDEDGDLTGGAKIQECYFINFSRLLTKDEIKKGSFSLELGASVTGTYGDNNFAERIKITDASGSDGYKLNSPAGEYGVLFATASAGTNVLSASLTMANDGLNQIPCGLVYYQAGIAVLSGSVLTSDAQATLADAIDTTGVAENDAFTMTVPAAAGGDATAHQLTFVADANAVNALSNANNWGVAIDVANTAAKQATAIINAINGTANAAVGYATNAVNSVLTAGTLGLTAALSTGETTKITLTITAHGPAGNVASVLAASTGFESALLLESTFVGGAVTPKSILGLGSGVDMLPAGDTSNEYLETMSDLLTGSNIETCANSLRNRIYNISFNNTTELNSTVYFCRTNHNEFNYSSNPTYVSGSKIQVKDVSVDSPVTYVTSIGLYDARKRLVAVAKLSEPIKKTPENEVTFRVRLDY